MVGWHRHIHSVLRRVGKRVEHNYNLSANFSSSHLEPSFSPGELTYFQRLWRPPSANISRPLYQYFQQLGISSSRKLLAESSEEAAIPSPLTPVLAISSGKGEDQNQKAVSKPSTVQAVLKGIKQSPKKVNLVAALVRGMRVEDALLQLQVTVKRAAKTVYQVTQALYPCQHYQLGVIAASFINLFFFFFGGGGEEGVKHMGVRK
ncbi:hypothetical protein CMV_030412 [Castanea mollissima]|uniref:50S ribosomal protein L22, chloroplastic n=1 Tax=Castanea mollissima TaxID=60419 RepID=A0A8J4Q4A3_9ROSI|nr:hypothetical protein CMV_030412 [Castanea mollissima]